ncbi:hypothetical protein F5141DRAFT_1069617 [Pisolithus sp. B1]|nr:hypothetical protein F5141DRAFT_1069617 [Pisolithus sp. B1]
MVKVGKNLRTIVLSSDSELRIQRKAIREAGCPKSKSKVFQSTWYISITQKREYVARGAIQSGQRREYGHWAARAFTWWRDKNSTRLRAGQVVSISSERRDLNRKSRGTSSTAQLVLSVKAMDMEVKKSDDESSKDSISVSQIEVLSPRQIRGSSPHDKPWQLNSLHPDPRMHSSRRKNE